MIFATSLLEGKLVKRYKRFFADIEHQGQIITAHVPNTGSMKGCNEPGSPCLFSSNDNPNRKLKYTLEMVQSNGTWVGVNTSHPNHLVKEAYDQKVIPEWAIFDQCKPEIKINAETRLDMLLSQSQTGKKHYIEVKNVTMAENKIAMFPDAVTERGQKHLVELMSLIDQGNTVELVFVIQRQDCEGFRAAHEIDPEYAELLKKAQKKGLIVSPFVVAMSPLEIKITGKKLRLLS